MTDDLKKQGAIETWNFTLSFAQRLCNPPGFAILMSLVFAFAVAAPLIYGIFPTIWFSIPLSIGVIVAWVKNVAAIPNDKSQRVIIAVKRGFLGVGTSNRFDWIPRHNVTRLSRGALGCHVVSLISGHTLVIPSKIAQSQALTVFMQNNDHASTQERQSQP